MANCKECIHYSVCGYVEFQDLECNQFIPTADVVKVKHGEWIVGKSGLYVCSECDKTCPYDVQASIIDYWECKYCPWCGAIMDGIPKESEVQGE